MITACGLLISTIISFSLGALLLLEIIFRDEDHDFDTPRAHLVGFLLLALAIFCGFTFWRYRRWFLSRAQETDS
jgi:hypothetical protein